jgi:GTP-binding protein Era
MASRCGTIAILGRPNVGKSTLLNRLSGNRLAITSPRPQTTRVTLRAIVTEGETQIVFVDTPGFNQQSTLLDTAMRRYVMHAIMEADLVMAVTELTPGQAGAAGISAARLRLHPADRALLGTVIREGKRPDIVVINKIDTLRDRRPLLPLMDLYRKDLGVETIFLVSARKGDGIGDLRDAIQRSVPERPFLFDPDQLSDRPERFFVAEMIREQIFRLARMEVPYASCVSVGDWKDDGKLIRIEARIIVEKSGQKAILVGKGGAMIKKIGTQARAEIERFLARHVFLGLTVDVKPDWREDARAVDKMIGGHSG